MPRVRKEVLKQGMQLGEDLRDKNGRMMMAKGSTLDYEKIHKIRNSDVLCPEISGISEEEIDDLHRAGVSQENQNIIEKLNEMQFSNCVEFDPFVKELKVISDRALYASLKS